VIINVVAVDDNELRIIAVDDLVETVDIAPLVKAVAIRPGVADPIVPAAAVEAAVDRIASDLQKASITDVIDHFHRTILMRIDKQQNENVK
jgi:hypothetical protein